MEKLSKIKLYEVPVLSKNEMKMIFGGSGNTNSSGTECPKAGAACDDKKEGDSCE